MGNLFKQKLIIVVAYGVLSLVIFFVSLAIYTNTLNDELNKYSDKVLVYIHSMMDAASLRNENAIDYAISDSYFNDSYDNILAKAKQDDHISVLCKEVKAIVPSVQTVVAIMENGDIYRADDTLDNYFEQFKNIKNCELYKDTCLENTFRINRYNKYYNVECYSYSNAIFDKDGRRVGTFIVTYSLEGHWNEINSLNKDDFSGSVIFETFDKQVLSIIDANGVERYVENELIGERAYEIIDKAKIVSELSDSDRKYKMYFIPNDNTILRGFDVVRTICVSFAILLLIAVIIVTNRRKNRYFLEIGMITISAIIVFLVIWFAFIASYFDVKGKTLKVNAYSDDFLVGQFESSLKRGMDAFTDYTQTTALKNVDTKMTTKEFANQFVSLAPNNCKDEYIKINKHFLFGKGMGIYVDENRKFNIETGRLEVPTLDEKTSYNKLVKSAENELSVTNKEDNSVIKTIYYKVRMLSKYTIVYSIKYDLTNFYENNLSDRFNIDELGETYFVDYNDGYKIALIRANEIATINNMNDTKYVECKEDIFGGNIKNVIEEEKDFDVYNVSSSFGNRNLMACINKKELKRVEVYFSQEENILILRNSMVITLFIEFGLFGILILYNYLENRRLKKKEKKEEIVLHGNY